MINFLFQAHLSTSNSQCRDDDKQSIDLEKSESKVEHGCELVVSQSIMERAKQGLKYLFFNTAQK